MPGGRAGAWLLVTGNRLLVAAGFIVTVYATVLVFARLGPGSVEAAITANALFALFTPALIGTIVGVTLILTFTQLVLSRELGSLGDQHERMTRALSFRRDTEEAAAMDAAPAEPSRFLSALMGATEDEATDIQSTLESLPDPPTEVIAYADSIIDDARRGRERLADEPWGIDVIAGTLRYDYSWKIVQGRTLQAQYGDRLPDEVCDSIEDLIELLSLYAPARAHFKTLYLRWEIINLGTLLVGLTIPVLALGAYVVLVLDPAGISGATAGFDHSFLLAAGAFVLVTSPFIVFLSYILRILTVTKWTLAIGPFVLRTGGLGGEGE